MPVGLTPAAREALIDRRVREVLAGAMSELRETERAADEIRSTPDIDQLRRPRVPRGTTSRSIDDLPRSHRSHVGLRRVDERSVPRETAPLGSDREASRRGSS
jgi:hypothetical protein